MSEGDVKKKKVPRQRMPELDPNVRVGSFSEVPQGLSPEAAVLEAKRCIQCKKPACVEGCPVSVDIPGFIKLIREEDFTGAICRIWEKNGLPAVCGRVCPQELQCEGKCVLGKKGDPVAIGNLERFAADYERHKRQAPQPSVADATGKKVAVVGSGPAGLTVASDLIQKGYAVSVFEAFHKPGGVLVYGIPEFRLPKEIVFSEVAGLQDLGVDLKCNSVVGRTVTLDELFDQGYSAVFLGVGAGLPTFLKVPGENLIGVMSANEYLTRTNLMKAYLYPEYDTPIIKGRKVITLGAGNVAMDAARTALRLGAEKSLIVYRRSRDEVPARAAEVHHAEEEGVEFFFLTGPVKFNGDDQGRLVSMTGLKMALGEPDDSGRRRPVPVPGSEFDLECDLAIVAVGSGANPLLTQTTDGLKTNEWGYIAAATDSGKTSKKGVWAGGDIVTGSATVILAMGAGRIAADSIHGYLSRGEPF